MNAPYHSKFGGLWIDRADWKDGLAARNLTPEQRQAITFFVENGYLILEGAAPLDKVDAFQREIEKSFREGNPRVLYQEHGSDETRSMDAPADRGGTRVVDCYVALPQALELFTSPRLMEFFRIIFDGEPHLFQSLSFDQGSQQGLHQDTAYVVVNRPLELAACWIALEDVRPGSGELMYAPGSHRYPDFEFGGDKKHWVRETDGNEPHDRWSYLLRERAHAVPGGVKTFLAKKGDILIWHADLAHGGSPVVDKSLSRQSLVGHFCPQSASPAYYANGRDATERYGTLTYSSGHYDMRVKR
jgi:phytanoyl-CoA hydroxylase